MNINPILACVCVWGARAPSRAGDGALAIANFVPGKKTVSARAPKPARGGACAPLN